MKPPKIDRKAGEELRVCRLENLHLTTSNIALLSALVLRELKIRNLTPDPAQNSTVNSRIQEEAAKFAVELRRKTSSHSDDFTYWACGIVALVLSEGKLKNAS